MIARGRALFTLEEANRSLPLVRSIVSDVATLWCDLMKVRDDYGNSSPDHDRILRELAEYIQELHGIGCHLRDFEAGLVDFGAPGQGAEAPLTWRLGEPSVTLRSRESERADEFAVPGVESEDNRAH
jgi:hypothetical protein